jgi:competence protein ComEC
MPFWDRSIDLVVLTHPESDHITGLIAALERYQVDAVVFRELEMDSATYARWLEVVVLHPGAVGAHRDAPLQGDANNNSVVTRLTYGQVSLLLPGDIEAEVERELVVGATRGSPLRSTVLKVPHHGSCSSTTQAFLDAVDPETAVISVGADNRLGHPCEEVLERLGDLPVYRTDEHGAVEVVSDGTQVWVETER